MSAFENICKGINNRKAMAEADMEAMKQSFEAPTIPPVVGKRMVMRNGEVTGVIDTGGNKTYPFVDGDYNWTAQGDAFGGCDMDIIAIHDAEAPTKPADALEGVPSPCASPEATEAPVAAPDMVNAPPHYRAHPSGVETITITEHMSFLEGNVIKYVMRADHKGNKLEDLRKAAWYLNRAIEMEQSK